MPWKRALVFGENVTIIRSFMSTLRFYEAVRFPYSDHWLVDLVDNTYRGEVTGLFLNGTPIADAPPIELALVKPGIPMDFGFSVMGVPLVSDRAARLLERVAAQDVQLIKSTVPGHRAYWAVNLLRMLDCVDEKLTKHLGKGGPEGYYVLAGDYKIDPERTAGSQIFRLRREWVHVVIGEQLKDAIVQGKLVGPGLMALDGSHETLMPGFERSQRGDGGARRRRSSRGKPRDRGSEGGRHP